MFTFYNNFKLKVFGFLNLLQTHLLLKTEEYMRYDLLVGHPKIQVSNPTLFVVFLFTSLSTYETSLLIC